MLTRIQITAALPRVAEGLRKYQALQRLSRRPRFYADPAFQRAFNHFYRVRRGKRWREEYFRLLGQAARRSISFRSVLARLAKSTGRYEASFASKLVATVDPSQPVIDSIVLRNLRLCLPKSRAPRRLDAIEVIHTRLHVRYREFLQTAQGRYLIKSFRRMYPDARITAVKMLDFVLWQTRSPTARAVSASGESGLVRAMPETAGGQ